jgi:rhodanese-related sulfurtransferase
MKFTSLALVAFLTATPLALGEDPKPAPATGGGLVFPADKGYFDVNPEVFEVLRKKHTNNIVVLDVRTPQEYAEGHIAGSVLLDFKSPDFAEKLSKLDKDKKYLVHCAAGGRSAKACTQLHQLGFQRVYNLEGGMKAWTAAGKPVETGAAPAAKSAEK